MDYLVLYKVRKRNLIFLFADVAQRKSSSLVMRLSGVRIPPSALIFYIMLKNKERISARALRQEGLSYREIQEKIKVSKSSISRWCKDIKLNSKQNNRLKDKKRKGAAKGRKTILKLRSLKQKN